MELPVRSPRRTRTLRSLQDEVSRLFESVFPGPDEGDRRMSDVWSPQLDVVETDSAYHLRMDLPGISREDVAITVEDNQLTIRGERTAETHQNEATFIRMERTFGTFYRSLRLPKAVNEDKIKATFTEGVLSVELPKTEKTKPKKIQIS